MSRRASKSSLSRRAWILGTLACGSAHAMDRIPLGGRATLYLPWPSASIPT